MQLEQTPLPGIGVRYDFCTGDGRQLGLVVRRDGTAELVVYAEDDADSVAEAIVLHAEERQALAELLAVPPGEHDPESRTHHRVWQLSEGRLE